MVKSNHSQAVTLTELLVVMAIVGILATLAVPAYINRMETAREAAARSEVKDIAQSLQTCLAVHSFYVPLQVLDDIAPDAIGSTSRDDSLDNEAVFFLIDPNVADLQNTVQLDLSDRDESPRVGRLYYGWQGPFLNPKRVFIAGAQSDDPDDLIAESSTLIQRDYPLDPWGQPYRFYSPIGLIGLTADNVEASSWLTASFSDGRITTNDDRFDRYAIVSYGRNNESDADNDGDDDIFYMFGRVMTETTLNTF
ncbi:prepilin-type N-terminal cleavage/methylation domain-containing protein [Candidatus Sumerlaeota bacterium]|nr:prepilin-type N-terminal cleavage/methylation domain-containing protein [Candidatus Sumerlaeota bacterium]